MKKIVLAISVFSLGLGLAIVIATAKPQPQTRLPDLPPPPIVNTLIVSPSKVRLSVTTQGTVQPRQQIDTVAQVAGIIESTSEHFAAGAFVKRGEPLLQIEAADYRFALVRTQAQVADAEQLLATERARADQAQKEWRDLGHRDANSLFLRKPQLASAQAKLAAALADRDAAKLNLSRTTIKAPFDGRIRNKFVDAGQYVTPGIVVAKLYASDSVEIRLPLTDKQLALLDLSSMRDQAPDNHPKVTITGTYAARQHQWQGYLVRSEASIDIKSRVLYVIAEVTKPFALNEEKSAPLSIGLFVEAQIQGREIDNVVTLPRQALQVNQQVLSLDNDNRLRFKAVEVLQINNEAVLVTGDFVAGERVVTNNLPMAVAGMLVSPKEPAIAATVNGKRP